MKDIRLMIARELNKIAKELIAGGEVANQEGKYKNFTGTIDWFGTKGKVKNATFELRESYNSYMIFEQGTWQNGICKYGVWGGGTWENGTWEGGDFQWGTWKDGTWKDGVFYGKTWNNGVWLNGTWRDGTWLNGYWYDGIWKNGTWWRGKDKRDKMHEKGDSPNKWEK